jgi:hypothetical protein
VPSMDCTTRLEATAGTTTGVVVPASRAVEVPDHLAAALTTG